MFRMDIQSHTMKAGSIADSFPVMSPVVQGLFLLMLVSGCTMVGPDFEPPEAPVPEAWMEQQTQVFKAGEAQLVDWWRVFDDPVLNNLVEEAYRQNLDLQVAGLRILEARARRGIATGTLYPQLQQINAGATAIQESRNAANTAAGDLRFQDLATSFDAAWELDFWGRFRRGVESADAEFLAAIADYDDVTVTLIAEVSRVYIEIRALAKRILLAEQSVAIQRRSHEIAENRFEGGLVTELDVQQARSLLANTRALVTRLQELYQKNLHALSVLLGTPPGNLSTRLRDAETSRPIPMPPREVAVGIPAELLRRRPDIRRAELQTAAQSALIGLAKADLYPHFALTGSIGLRASESPLTRTGGSHVSDLFSSDSLTYFAGPSLSWDVFNYGRIKNQVRVQDARFKQQVVIYRNTVLRAYQEVEDAMVGFLKRQEEANYLLDAVEASQRSVDISGLQYGEGMADYQRVLDAQRSLTSSQDALAEIQGNVALELINLYKALGGGWQANIGATLTTDSRQKMVESADQGGLPYPPPQEAEENIEK